MEEQKNKLPDNPLWKDEVFTDGGAVRIIRRIPITLDEEIDLTRKIEYQGLTMCHFGLQQPINVQFDIPASSLREAKSKYAELLDIEAKATFERIKEAMDQKGKIIVPDKNVNAGKLKLVK